MVLGRRERRHQRGLSAPRPGSKLGVWAPSAPSSATNDPHAKARARGATARAMSTHVAFGNHRRAPSRPRCLRARHASIHAAWGACGACHDTRPRCVRASMCHKCAAHPCMHAVSHSGGCCLEGLFFRWCSIDETNQESWGCTLCPSSQGSDTRSGTFQMVPSCTNLRTDIFCGDFGSWERFPGY